MRISAGSPLASSSWFNYIYNFQAFGGQVVSPAVAAQFSHIQFENPIGSSRIVVVKRVELTPGATMVVRSSLQVGNLGGAAGVTVNLRAGGALPISTLAGLANVAELSLGGMFQQLSLLPQPQLAVAEDWMFQLRAGDSLVFAGRTVLTSLTASVFWIEFPA